MNEKLLFNSEKSAVFIVGAPRSGTTLLREILDRHSRIGICPETHYFSHFRRDLFFRQFGILALKKSRVSNTLFNQLDKRTNAVGQVISQTDSKVILRALKNYSFFLTSGIELDALVFDHSKLPAYLGTFRAWVKAYAQTNNKEIAGEKTPIHVKSMHQIQQAFPEARFLHIIRDPYATIASLKKAGWLQQKEDRGVDVFFARLIEKFPSRSPIEQNIELWKQCNLINTEGINRYYRVQFEKLVSEPEKAVRKICGFLGVDFETQMLLPRSNNVAIYKRRGETWKANAVLEVSAQYVTSSIADLDDAEVQRIVKLIDK